MAKIYKAKMLTDTKVVTGKVRLSFPHLLEKYDKSDKYQCQLLISKDDKDTIGVIKKAIEAAKEQGKTDKWGGKVPGNFASPIHDGDDKDDAETYGGCYYLSAKSTRKPQVVDLDRDEIYDEDEVYPGCYVRASISFFAYNQSGNGVGCILNHIQKLEDGERLGGGVSSAADDFSDDDDELDDDLL